MSISIVYESKSTTGINFEIQHKPEVATILAYLVEFLTNNPTALVYNEHSESFDHIDIRAEVKFVDQTQLDLYLTDPRNIKSMVDGFNADSEIIAFCATNGCTLSTVIVNDTATTRGILTTSDLANSIVNDFS